MENFQVISQKDADEGWEGIMEGTNIYQIPDTLHVFSSLQQLCNLGLAISTCVVELG